MPTSIAVAAGGMHQWAHADTHQYTRSAAHPLLPQKLPPRMRLSVCHLIVMTNFSLPPMFVVSVGGVLLQLPLVGMVRLICNNMQQHATTVGKLHDKAKLGK